MSEPSALATVPLFADLPASELAVLAADLRPRRYARDATIFLTGDPGTSLCIIEAGQVRLGFTSTEGKQSTFALLGPGEVFGELALLDGQPRSADAIATEPSRLL